MRLILPQKYLSDVLSFSLFLLCATSFGKQTYTSLGILEGPHKVAAAAAVAAAPAVTVAVAAAAASTAAITAIADIASAAAAAGTAASATFATAAAAAAAVPSFVVAVTVAAAMQKRMHAVLACVHSVQQPRRDLQCHLSPTAGGQYYAQCVRVNCVECTHTFAWLANSSPQQKRTASPAVLNFTRCLR